MSIEAMKQALEALEGLVDLAHEAGFPCDRAEATIKSLRQAIEAAEKQEPVAYLCENAVGHKYFRWKKPSSTYKSIALYTAPQPQEFVCSTGLCHFTLTQTNVGIGERGMEAYEAAKKRGWVGVSDERLMEMPQQEPVAWITHESKWRLTGGGNAGGTVPVHAKQSNTAKYPLYTAPQPQQEPVKMVAYNCLCGRIMKFESVNGIVAPQREWVGLTDEEIALVCAECAASAHNWNDISFAHAIEAKLKEKNSGKNTPNS